MAAFVSLLTSDTLFGFYSSPTATVTDYMGDTAISYPPSPLPVLLTGGSIRFTMMPTIEFSFFKRYFGMSFLDEYMP